MIPPQAKVAVGWNLHLQLKDKRTDPELAPPWQLWIHHDFFFANLNICQRQIEVLEFRMGIGLLQNAWHIRFLHKPEMGHNRPDTGSQVVDIILLVWLNAWATLLINREQEEVFSHGAVPFQMGPKDPRPPLRPLVA